MINRLLYRLTAHLPCRLIWLGDSPYLERYYIGQLWGCTFYLHRFVSPDSERHLHNHPWAWGRALVLSGGYTEEYVTDICPHAGPSGCLTERRRIRWYNRIDGSLFHRIHDARPGTWTLFAHGKRVVLPDGQLKGWGFLEAIVGRTHTMFKPHTSSSPLEWWKCAPLGGAAGREPCG